MFYSHFLVSLHGLFLQKRRNNIWLTVQITSLQSLSLIRGHPHKRPKARTDDTKTARNTYCIIVTPEVFTVVKAEAPCIWATTQLYTPEQQNPHVSKCSTTARTNLATTTPFPASRNYSTQLLDLMFIPLDTSVRCNI